MDNRFLLSCTCGRQLTIDPGQTGQELTCACGLKVQAPGTLQELRKLPRVKPEDSETPAAKWGETPRAVFGCGSLLVMIGLVVGGYFGYHWYQVRGTEKPDADHVRKHLNENFDQLKPTEILEIWQEWGKDLPANRDKPVWIQLREVSAQFLFLASIGGGVAILGIAVCIGASWLARSPEKDSG